MSLQYIQDKDITVCTLGAHQALIKVTSQNSVKRSNGKLLATENDRMGECYGCYKTPDFISVLSTVLMNMTLLTSVLCQQAAIGGALAGLVVGALRGWRAGKDASKDMGFFNKVGTMISATVQGAQVGSTAGAVLGAVGMYSFLHGKVSKMVQNVIMPNICAAYTKMSTWSRVHSSVKISGQKALLEGAMLNCIQGGLITIIKPDFSEAAKMLVLSYFAYNRMTKEKANDYKMDEAMDGLSPEQQAMLKNKDEKLDGYEKLDEEEMKKLGVKSTELNDTKTGFKADIYKDKNGDYVLVYRGTYSDPDHPENDLIHDWSKEWTDDNMKQGLGMGSEQYEKSIDIAKRVNRNKPKDKQLTIAGHSLGGGLATAAGAATGSKTYAFCPAGVHPNTYKMYGVKNPDTSKVHTYYSNQDFLNMASNNLSLMPKAAGERIMLNTLDSFDFTKGHDLPLLFKAIQAEEAELGRPIIANIL
ncbi:lipase [uncultured Prevotella sp.]|jgi:lipase family protein|uniref:lipase n=1 Tax=uncultured Prevotella sp. TaxID=159272 RepID=UPI002595771C|nr:lipase [uncultured Prevotella sp.]